jgi:D-alanyl-D-alanine carboxypeptidase/D-alanyl-D-alanine-endopeptidase (penicillin-binding protein 4)
MRTHVARGALSLVILLAAIGCATAPQMRSATAAPRPSIEDAARRAMTTPPFDHALWFALVEDEGGKVLYAHNADKLAITASTRKMFAMATALTCFGADAQFQTQLFRYGDDVVIRGDGDPSFGTERYAQTPESTFRPFVDALRQRGVTRVHDVITDVSLFDRTTIPGGWKVGNLPGYYAAPIDALTFDESAIGEESVPSPGLRAAEVFRDQLRFAGIAVDGHIRLNVEPQVWGSPLATIRSPFLAQLMTTVLKNSQNLYAETLYKRVSAPASQAAQPAASYDESERVESGFLQSEVGITPAEVRFVDGSGLAPDDLAAPTAMLKMLRWMNDPARRGYFWQVMAQPGGEGTLRLRLTELAGRLRAKTGSVNGVNALAGIVRGSDGRYRYFFIDVNHHTGRGSEAIALIDGIVRAVAEF